MSKIEKSMLGRFGHVERMSESRLTKSRSNLMFSDDAVEDGACLARNIVYCLLTFVLTSLLVTYNRLQ